MKSVQDDILKAYKQLEKPDQSFTLPFFIESTKSKDSPVHDLFMWDDDKKAANEYRYHAARSFLQSIGKLVIHHNGVELVIDPKQMNESEINSSKSK